MRSTLCRTSAEKSTGTRRRYMAVAIALAASVFAPGSGHAASVFVDGRATGQFGTYGPAAIRDGLDLVEVVTFASAGEAIDFTAAGSLYLGTGALPTTGPDGAGPFDRVAFLASSAAFLPLEEALVDGGGSLSPSFDQIGAVFAAFVPAGVRLGPGFLARNLDVGGSIASDSLFLVGSGPVTFVAPGPGSLFFGVNDSFGNNNTGGYTVTTMPVPEPSTGLLVLLGLGALSGASAKSTRRMRDRTVAGLRGRSREFDT